MHTQTRTHACMHTHTLTQTHTPAHTDADAHAHTPYTYKDTSSMIAIHKSSKQAVFPAVCLLNKDPGPCQAFFKNWYFDAASEECVEFVYGGCGGNNNRFATKDECKNTCRELLKKKKIGAFTHLLYLNWGTVAQ